MVANFSNLIKYVCVLLLDFVPRMYNIDLYSLSTARNGHVVARSCTDKINFRLFSAKHFSKKVVFDELQVLLINLPHNQHWQTSRTKKQ